MRPQATINPFTQLLHVRFSHTPSRGCWSTDPDSTGSQGRQRIIGNDLFIGCDIYLIERFLSNSAIKTVTLHRINDHHMIVCAASD